MNEAYRELFLFRSSFVRVLGAFSRAGRVPARADGRWRLWDLYRLIKEVGNNHSIVMRDGTSLGIRTARFPDLDWLNHIEESFWEAIEEARIIRDEIEAACYTRHIRDKNSGKWRYETPSEWKRRFAPYNRARKRRLHELAKSISAERNYWKERLNILATTAIELRQHGLANSARLCASHLFAGVDLAGLRLNCSFREVRSLVGHSPADLEAPALTAASSSPERQGLYIALDEVEKELPEYRRSLAPAVHITAEQAEAMFLFFDDIGLLEWPSSSRSSTGVRRVFGRRRSIDASPCHSAGYER